MKFDENIFGGVLPFYAKFESKILDKNMAKTCKNEGFTKKFGFE